MPSAPEEVFLTVEIFLVHVPVDPRVKKMVKEEKENRIACLGRRIVALCEL